MERAEELAAMAAAEQIRGLRHSSKRVRRAVTAELMKNVDHVSTALQQPHAPRLQGDDTHEWWSVPNNKHKLAALSPIPGALLLDWQIVALQQQRTNPTQAALATQAAMVAVRGSTISDEMEDVILNGYNTLLPPHTNNINNNNHRQTHSPAIVGFGCWWLTPIQRFFCGLPRQEALQPLGGQPALRDLEHSLMDVVHTQGAAANSTLLAAYCESALRVPAHHMSAAGRWMHAKVGPAVAAHTLGACVAKFVRCFDLLYSDAALGLGAGAAMDEAALQHTLDDACADVREFHDGLVQALLWKWPCLLQGCSDVEEEDDEPSGYVMAYVNRLTAIDRQTIESDRQTD
jgi:hypothetical protein